MPVAPGGEAAAACGESVQADPASGDPNAIVVDTAIRTFGLRRPR